MNFGYIFFQFKSVDFLLHFHDSSEFHDFSKVFFITTAVQLYLYTFMLCCLGIFIYFNYAIPYFCSTFKKKNKTNCHQIRWFLYSARTTFLCLICLFTCSYMQVNNHDCFYFTNYFELCKHESATV